MRIALAGVLVVAGVVQYALGQHGFGVASVVLGLAVLGLGTGERMRSDRTQSHSPDKVAPRAPRRTRQWP